MLARARGLRLPEELQDEIEREMRLRGATFSEVATSLLREAVRMRRVPGIVFMDGPVGRRASIAGTGLDVWEVIATFKSVEEDRRRPTGGSRNGSSPRRAPTTDSTRKR
jgi:hypothetical protein